MTARSETDLLALLREPANGLKFAYRRVRARAHFPREVAIGRVEVFVTLLVLAMELQHL